MPDLGNAYVNIVPKAPGIESKVEDLLGGGSGGAEKAGEAWGKKLISGIGALGIGAAVGSIVKESFEAGGALQQSFGGLDTIYGEAAAAAKEYAMAAASAGISANDYAEQAVSFGAALKKAYGGDTTQAMEAANAAILDMADNAAKMGTPLESIQAAYQGFARGQYTLLDNLKLGYGGTQEEMLRLLADAEKLTGVTYDINNLGDVYDAIHAIQGELGLTGVAAAEAEGTFTGSMGALNASWENLMGALTTGDGLETAMANLGTSVQNFAAVVVGMFGTLSGQLPDLVLGLAQVVIDNAPMFIRSGVDLIVKLGVGLVQAIPQIVAMIPELMFSVMDAFAQVDWWSVGADVIEGIISGLWGAAGRLWEAFKNLAKSALQSAKNYLGIASPSKAFAQEVGRWIPAGIGEGIQDNLAPVTSSVQTMAGVSLQSLEPVQLAGNGNPGGTETAEVLQQLLEALAAMKFDFYMDGRQITDAVTIRQRQAARSGGIAG